MDSYTPLLERLRVPQPSLQRFAAISVFEKLRSSPPHLGADSTAGREAISRCLLSSSATVVDQSVRELCRLVTDSKLDLQRGFLELQSALEGCDSRFVPLFVKAIGSLTHFGFRKNSSKLWFNSLETHPFSQVLMCRAEAQPELLQQVILFIVGSKQFGMTEVCKFLKTFLNFSILRIPNSDSLRSYSFLKQLISSISSLCCSFPLEAIPLFELLMQCLAYFPRKSAEDFMNFIHLMEFLVESYTFVLRQIVTNRSDLVDAAQNSGMRLLDIIFSSMSNSSSHFGVTEAAVELSRCLLVAQKELNLPYMHEVLSSGLSLFYTLIRTDLEHEQLPILKFLLFLLNWKSESETVGRSGFELTEEVLFVFPIINLISSPSKSIKGVASDLLLMLERRFHGLLIESKTEMIMQQGFPEPSRPETIIFRLVQHLWSKQSNSSYFFSNFVSLGKTENDESYEWPKSWVSHVKDYMLWIVERRKSPQATSHSQDAFSSEIMLFASLSGVLVMHPSLGKHAADSLAASGVMEPKLGVTLLLAILFYNNLYSNQNNKCDMSLKCLGMLPSLASHSAMTPLVVQTILPMLHKDAKPVLRATATRLLCKTWETNDRAFGSLQGVLLPNCFTEFVSERSICISIAASIRDVCRNNPDRGVDLILSISACIESPDAKIQALGFQSLAHLCEADVIDFYTAWDVIAKHVLDYSVDPVFSHCLCTLLRWGATDAEAYSEASRKVIQILWEVCSSKHHGLASLWAKAQISAFEALTHYQVFHIEKCVPGLKNRSLELLISENNPEVLGAVERFQVKIMMHEHMTRRRLVKEKRVTGNRIEKLLDVSPQVIFSTGKGRSARELPGAALLSLSFTPKDVTYQGASKVLHTVHSSYESALVDIAGSLQISRNIMIALLSLQSWKPFMQRWVRAIISHFDAKSSSSMLEQKCKAANYILKSLIQIAEESIPRSAENIALAIGALCVVLPSSAHAVKASAAKYLLNWLFQYEHEYRQWSAAVSLGLISSCLHVTDHKQKFETINGLIEVISSSKSTLVRGACGVGLGFSCQDLFTGVKAAEDSKLDEETYKMQESELLGKVVRTLSLMIYQVTQCSFEILQNIAAYFAVDTHVMFTESSSKSCDDLEDDIWGVVGLVLGLGNCVSAIYRAGLHDLLLKVKSLIMSWFFHSIENFGSCSEKNEKVLSVGSCLALPTLVAFCRRVELMDDDELGHLLDGYRELISELTSIKKSGIFHQSLLMASYTGAGNLLACILNEGVRSVRFEDVKDLLDLFRKGYSSPYPPSVHLGGMLGVVNALGAGAGTPVHRHSTCFLYRSYEKADSSYVMGPLLSNSACEQQLTSLMQEIFFVAQKSEDHQLQQYAAWAVSFLRHGLWSKDIPNSESTPTDTAGSRSLSHGISDESLVMKLSQWLLNHSGTGMATIISLITVLRCLSRLPRLPAIDWGAIIRRCMRQDLSIGGSSHSFPAQGLSHKKATLREECILFSIAHANQFNELQSFLDELSDLSRFRSLELNLQACLLTQLGNLNRAFSESRLEKLFNDLVSYFTSLSSSEGFDANQKGFLRVSCWKGLYLCLDDDSLDSSELISKIGKCMEILFFSLPALQSARILGLEQANILEEWSKAIRCLGKSPQEWLSELLQVDAANEGGDIVKVAKKLQGKARLVKNGFIPWTDLGRLKAYMVNFEPHVIWDVLVEVVAALQHLEGSVKRQWLLDVVEICCISNYPSTALQFLGLLSGSFCRYMPLLILDRYTVISDLPVTLTSLMSEPSWGTVAETVASHIWTSTRRIHSWATDQCTQGETSPPIDESERGMGLFLLRVLHRTCILLKDYLSLEKQLWLVNIVVN